MSATNHTTNLGLPEYIGSDHPTYLGDWNETVRKIDTFAGEIGETVSTSSSQIEGLRNSVSHVQSEITLQQGVLEALNGRLTAEELKNTEQDTSISKLNNDTESLDTRVEALENSGLSEQVSLNTQNIVALQGDVHNLNTIVDGLENSIGLNIEFYGSAELTGQDFSTPYQPIMLVFEYKNLTSEISEIEVKSYLSSIIDKYSVKYLYGTERVKTTNGWVNPVISGCLVHYKGQTYGSSIPRVGSALSKLGGLVLNDYINNTLPTSNIGDISITVLDSSTNVSTTTFTGVTARTAFSANGYMQTTFKFTASPVNTISPYSYISSMNSGNI